MSEFRASQTAAIKQNRPNKSSSKTVISDQHHSDLDQLILSVLDQMQFLGEAEHVEPEEEWLLYRFTRDSDIESYLRESTREQFRYNNSYAQLYRNQNFVVKANIYGYPIASPEIVYIDDDLNTNDSPSNEEGPSEHIDPRKLRIKAILGSLLLLCIFGGILAALGMLIVGGSAPSFAFGGFSAVAWLIITAGKPLVTSNSL